MAKIHKNKKKFKVIAVTDAELMNALEDYGCMGIYDSCGERHRGIGYYVAVLNRWLCPKCYEEWYKTAVKYAEDEKYEEEKHSLYKQILGVGEDSSLPIGINMN